MLHRLRLRIPLVALVVVVAAGAACEELPPTTPLPLLQNPLAVTGFQPVTGNIYGGTRITINGSGFASGSVVSIGGVPALNPAYLSSTQLMVTTPSHTAGPVGIVVTSPKGRSVAASAMFTYAAAALRSFEDPATGFKTSELRDGLDQVFRLDQDGFLIFPDGTGLPGFKVDAPYILVPSGCQCALEVRFGSDQGQQRAYLTAEYGHFNPATLVNLNLVNGGLVVSPTVAYPPGTLTLSGTITELMESGESPLEGAWVGILISGGWREVYANNFGRYEIRGLVPSSLNVQFSKSGYESATTTIKLEADHRLDVRLSRR